MQCKNNLDTSPKHQDLWSWKDMRANEGVYKALSTTNDHRIVVLHNTSKIAISVIYVTSEYIRPMHHSNWDNEQFIKTDEKVSMAFSK